MNNNICELAHQNRLYEVELKKYVKEETDEKKFINNYRGSARNSLVPRERRDSKRRPNRAPIQKKRKSVVQQRRIM
jgi:hypothetical protein